MDAVNVAQLIVAGSVGFVWVFRFHNVEKEFNQFGLSSITRSAVGASKTALATLLIVGVWYSDLVLIPAILMGLFMVGAQYFHFKAGNLFKQRVPSLVLLALCAYIAASSGGLI